MSELQQQDIHVLMIGKGGVGKSSLANAILGKGSPVTDVDSVPGQIGMYKDHKLTKAFNEVIVHVYDTRGLLDGDGDTSNMAEEIRKETLRHGSFDIVIACVKFNDRFDQSNRAVFDVISKLDRDIWPKVYVALTHSDIIPADWSKNEIGKRYKGCKEEWEKAINEYIDHDQKVVVELTSHTEIKVCADGLQAFMYSNPLQKWLKHFLLQITCTSVQNGQVCGLQIALANAETHNTIKRAMIEMMSKEANIWECLIEEFVRVISAKTKLCNEFKKKCHSQNSLWNLLFKSKDSSVLVHAFYLLQILIGAQ